MNGRVGIIGIGYTAAQPTTPYSSFKELMFEAAQRAYLDAGIDAAEVESFVTCAEDLNTGLSIFDEYTPDQLGAVQKPMHTLTQDGLHGIADAVMQIKSGLVEVVAVEAHSKASNILTPDWILDYAVDPIFNRPLGFNPHAIAGLEMNLFLHETGITPQQVSQVAAKNRTNALRNPLAAYPARLTADDTAAGPYAHYPLRETEMAQTADGCVVVVLASDDKARAAASQPLWVRGVGFANDSPTLESRDWVRAEYTRIAAQMAYRMAGIREPRKEINLAEPYDPFAYKELHHLEGLQLAPKGQAPRLLADGVFDRDGDLPTCPSGGLLGVGNPISAAGMMKLCELFWQLRGEAGPRQVPGRPRRGVAQAWGDLMQVGTVVVMGVN